MREGGWGSDVTAWKFIGMSWLFNGILNRLCDALIAFNKVFIIKIIINIIDELTPFQLHPLNVYLNSDSPIEKELNWTFIIFGFTAVFRSGEFKCLFDMNCERDENNLHEILN